MAAPKIGQWTQDITTNSGGWFAGNGFTGTLNFHYDPTRSITATNNVYSATDQKNEIKASLEGGYYVTNPTTITWSSNVNKVNANFTVYDDTVLQASPSPDQPNYSYCCPFAVKNATGYSSTYVFNKPKQYGIAGHDPTKLYYGNLYPFTGRHMEAWSTGQTSLWLLPSSAWTGSAFSVNTAALYPLNLTQPGGYGNGNGTSPPEKAKDVLFFEVPNTVPAGNYYLVNFTNENRYGISISATAAYTVIATQDPWLSNPTIKTDLMSTASGTDISQALTVLLLNAAFAASKPTEAAPWLIKLPPGVFYLSHMIPWPDHTGLIGAGMHQTRVVPNPSLTGLANQAGSFYYNLGTYSTDNSNCYGATINGVGSQPAGIFSGDQRINGSRGAMIRPRGNNILFKDLTFELSPTNWRQTVPHIMGVSNSSNRVQFEKVRIFNPLATQTDFGGNSGGYLFGAIYRFSAQCKYWRFRDCDFHCDQVIEQTDAKVNGFSGNGAFDNMSIEGGTFHAVHNKTCAANFGGFGRYSLAYGLEIRNARRGFLFTYGTGFMESTIACCSFTEMLSEFGSGECNLIETRSADLLTLTSATTSTFTVASYKADGVTTSGDAIDRTRQTAYIVSGTGQHQYRVIASSSSGTHTLETPFEIAPDSSSKIVCVQTATDCDWVFNRFSDTVGGVNLYGSSFGCRLSSNWFRTSHEGVMLNTVGDVTTAAPNSAGLSVAMWNGSRRNTFEDTAGHSLIAPRTASDLGSYTYPQIAFTSINGNIYYGDVINQLWAAEGTETTSADETMLLPSNYSSVKLIEYTNCNAEYIYTDRSRYNHTPIATTFLQRAPWHKSIAGVGTFLLTSIVVDDRAVSNTAPLISTSAASPAITTGEYSLTTLTGNDIVNVSANVSTLLTRVGTPATTVSGAVDAINTKTAQITITGGGDVRAALSSVGLDSIAVDRTPTWPPTNARQLLNWLLVRFFNRTAKSSGTLTIYGSNNTTPISAQTYTEGVVSPNEEIQSPS